MVQNIISYILITVLIFSSVSINTKELLLKDSALKPLSSKLAGEGLLSKAASSGNMDFINKKGKSKSFFVTDTIVFLLFLSFYLIIPNLLFAGKYISFKNFISPNIEIVTYDANTSQNDVLTSIKNYYDNPNRAGQVNTVSDFTFLIAKLFNNSAVYSDSRGVITKICVYPDRNDSDIKNGREKKRLSELELLLKEYEGLINNRTMKGWEKTLEVLKKISDLSPETAFKILEDASAHPSEDGAICIFSFPYQNIKKDLTGLMDNLSLNDKERFFSLVKKPMYMKTAALNVIHISYCDLELALEFAKRLSEDDIEEMFYSIAYRKYGIRKQYPYELIERLVFENGEEWINANQDRALRSMIDNIANNDHGYLKLRTESLDEFLTANISASTPNYNANLITYLLDIGRELLKLTKLFSDMAEPTVEEKMSLLEYYEQMRNIYEEVFGFLDDFNSSNEVNSLTEYYIRQGEFDKVKHIYETAVNKDIHVYDSKQNDMSLWFSKMCYEFWKESGNSGARNWAEHFYEIMKAEYGIYDFDMDKFFSFVDEWGDLEWEKAIAIARGEAVVEFGIDSETGNSVSDYNKKASSLSGDSLIKIDLNSDKKEGLPIIKLPQQSIEYENYATNKMEPSLIPFLKSNFNAVFSELFLLLMSFSAIIGWFVSKMIYKNCRLETNFDVLGDTKKKIARKQTFLNTLEDRLAKGQTVTKRQNKSHSFTLFRTATELERQRILIENRSFPFIAFNGQDAKKAVSQQYSDFPKAVPEFEYIGHKISKEVLAVYSSC